MGSVYYRVPVCDDILKSIKIKANEEMATVSAVAEKLIDQFIAELE
jgi:hypothetical protein